VTSPQTHGPSTATSVGAWSLLAFGCELALVALAAVTGWRLGPSPVWSALLMLAFPGVVVLVWGRWFAPRSAHRLARPARFALQLTLFVVVAALAALVGLLAWGVALTVLAAVAFGLAKEPRAPGAVAD
jgi:hypothetical protein